MIGKILLLTTLALTQGKVVRDGGPVASDLCPAQGHYLLPHEYDCTKFYYCEYGMKWVNPRDCSPGTEFSYELQVCIHPNQANCNLPGTPPDTEEPTEAPTQTPVPIVTTEATTEPPTQTPAVIVTTEAPTVPPTQTPVPIVTTEAPTEPPTQTPVPIVTTEATTEPPTQTPAVIVTTEAPTVPPTQTPVPIVTTEAPTEPPTQTPVPIVTTEATTEPPTQTPVPIVTTEAPAPTTLPTEKPDLELLPNGCPADFEEHLLLPHETKCDQFYYCVFGEKVERQCSPGTQFNAAIQACDWPENVGCVDGGSLDSEEDVEGSGDPDIGGDSSEVLPNGCPADFDVHKLLPHESDCSKFYYCVLGETVERQCTPGTQFNPELQVCDWSENVRCVDGGTSSSEDDLEGSGESDIGGDSSEVLPNGCPADFDIHKLLPHESDCSKFYYCVLGETVERQCAPGTLFNPELQVCDHPENAGCANSGANGSEEVSISSEGSGGSEEIDEGIQLLPNGCPADFDVHQLLPHESDCAKFYYCVLGEKVERDCGPGTHFNPTLQVCDWPQNAKCANAGNSGENGNGQESENSDEGSGGDVGTLPNGCPADFDVHQLLPHESDCAKFYYCVLGEKVERDCGPGTHFNPTEQVCDWPDNVQCVGGAGSPVAPEPEPEESAEDSSPTLPNGCPADFDVHQLLPHESDCAKFYYCVLGEKVERDCGPGTHFNPTLQVCDWPQNAGCASGGNGGSGENGGGAEGSGENGDSGEIGTVIPSEKCKTSCNIAAWAHEHDCDKYWRCDGENAVLGTCSEGLDFNVNTLTCDFISNAGCARDGVQSTPERRIEALPALG